MTSNPVWQKSRHSSSNGGACVELADLGTVVGVRDSTDPDGPKLIIARHDLTALLETLKG